MGEHKMAWYGSSKGPYTGIITDRYSGKRLWYYMIQWEVSFGKKVVIKMSHESKYIVLAH